jgi:DNA polymerase III subunit beta
MKITCNRDKILPAFLTAAGVAPARSPKPILKNVKLEAADGCAVLSATDLDVGIRFEVPGIEVDVPGSTLLPIDRFGSILRESADASLRLEADGKGTLVRGERSQFKLPSENPAEFPSIPEFSGGEHFEIPARLLREMIRRTVFATDNESSRYALGGVLLEFDQDRLTAVATDGRRLTRMEGPAHRVGAADPQAGDRNTIVPTRSMLLIEKALSDADAEVQIAVRDNDILVRSQRATIYSRLVDGRFPRWRDVFPDGRDAIRIEMVAGPLHSAVRQAMIVTSDESRGVDFQFGDGLLVLTAQSPELGQSRVELPIGYDGAQVAVMLDPRYVSDFLKVLDPEKTFTLEVKDAESAAVARTDDGYGYDTPARVTTGLARRNEQHGIAAAATNSAGSPPRADAPTRAGERDAAAMEIPVAPRGAAEPMNPDEITPDDLAWIARRGRTYTGRHRARQPKHVANVLAQLLARRGYAQVQSADDLAAAWREAAGPQAAQQTRVVGLRRGQLEIVVAGSAWMQELTFRKTELLARLVELVPGKKIRGLRYRSGNID